MTANTYQIEVDETGSRVMRIPLDERKPVLEAWVTEYVAPTARGLTWGAVTAGGVFIAALAEGQGWEACVQLATQCLRLSGPVALAITYLAIPVLRKLKPLATKAQTDIPEPPTPRTPVYGKRHPNPAWGNGRQSVGELVQRLAKRAQTARQTMAQDAQPVQAEHILDWRPEFVRVTRRMYHWCEEGGGLTRPDFDHLWENGQDVYYRYVGNREKPFTWENGRWRWLDVVQPRLTTRGKPDERGPVQFAQGMSLDDILDYARNSGRRILPH